MHYFIQENLFKEVHYQKLIDLMGRFGLDHQIVKIVPFTREIQFEPIEGNNVFVFGSVKMSHIASDYGWYPGSMYNANHDYRVYSRHYKENLLNYDSLVCKFSDKLSFKDEYRFIRPCEDTKTFTGKVFTNEEWVEFVDYSLTNGHTTTLNGDTPIQVCSVKSINREIRAWVIDGKMVTASQYKQGDSVFYHECNEPYVRDFVEEMAKIYCPADAFVMDVAMTMSGAKIVEINCINSAGFYECNMQRLLEGIENRFGLRMANGTLDILYD